MTPSRARVLMLVDQLEPHSGGGERFAVGLGAQLRRDGFDVALCATRAVLGDWPRRLAESGLPWFALGRRATADVLPLGRLARLLRAQEVGVLHAHMFGSNVWGTLVGRAARVPVVLAQEQTWDYVGQPVRKALDGHFIGRFADAFVAVSTADRDRMVALEGVAPEKTVVELNGFVPRSPSPPPPRSLREVLGLPEDTLLVGAACIFRPQKALEVMLEAFSQLDRPHVHLVLAGDGSERPGLESLAANLQIAQRTHFLGMREDVDRVLEALDVAIISSDFEGSPLFGFECMAAGTPLVATRVGALPEMVEHRRSALLVARRDPPALAAALRELVDDPRMRAELAREARLRVARWHMTAVAARYGELYTRLLAGGRP